MKGKRTRTRRPTAMKGMSKNCEAESGGKVTHQAGFS